MKTVTVQIGNSDDKLSQSTWHNFVTRTHMVAIQFFCRVHFVGASNGDAMHQNACFVFDTDNIDGLRAALSELAHDFNQDSIAMTVGETEMVTPLLSRRSPCH